MEINYNQKFDLITKELYEEIIHGYPETATYLGIHDNDHLLSDPHRNNIFNEITFYDQALKKLELIPRQKLDKNRLLDLKILRHLKLINEFSLKEIRQWEKNPDAINNIASIIFLQFTRNYAPLEKRIADITGRLDKLPVYLERFKTRITDPVLLWTELAIESTEFFPNFLNTIVLETKNLLTPDQYKQLKKTMVKSKKTTTEFITWLKSLLPHAAKNCILGKDLFDRLIALREIGLGAVSLRPEEILSIGKDYLRKLKVEQKKLARQISPGKSLKSITKKIKANHPGNFKKTLDTYQETMEQTRKFILAHKLASIPKGDELLIIETPEFMQHLIPFAAYFSPARFDRKQTGIYLVTPPADKKDLTEYCYASIANTTVHEGYPGHHLQFLWANKNPSYVRLLSGLADTGHELVEGWAHYCEDMMMENGYNNNPEAHYIKTLDGIWRAARIIIDIKLSSGAMSFNEAADFLEKETEMPKESAVREIQRYTQSPGYQLSYLIGKHLILELKDSLKKSLKEKYSDKLFHDTILKSGSIPLKYIHKVLSK